MSPADRHAAQLSALIADAETEANSWAGSAHVRYECLFALHRLLDFARAPLLCTTIAEQRELHARAEEAWSQIHPGRDRVCTTLCTT